MKIGELAKLTGLSASRIRFYESAGLLTAAKRQANGYRDYPAETVSMLEIINSAQGAGFSLEQIRHLLPLGDGSWNHDDLVQALRTKAAEIDALLKQLKQSKAQLLIAIDTIESRPDDIDCVDNRIRILEQLRGKGVMTRIDKK